MFTNIVNITYSYFLYNISRPTKYGVPQLDLSLDEVNIEAPESLSHNQSLVERVICKTFTHHKCDVVITDRLRSLFTNKLLRMGKTMHKLGGRGRANQIEKWKETNWSLVLQPNEIVPRSKKRKAEHVFVQDQVKKIAQLQDNLENCQQSLKAANIKLHKVEEKHKQLATSLNSKVTKHHKSWSQYSAQYKRQQKKQIASNVCTALKFTENTHFRPSEIQLQNIETNDILSIHLDGSFTSTKPKSLSENKDTIIKQTLYVKERFNISDKAYHELSMVHPSLPCWSTINKTSKEMDCNSTICPTPGPILGLQQSLKNCLTVRLEHMVNLNPSLKMNQL